MSTAPLALPPNFNPATHMLSKQTEYGLFHESRQAARLAAQLVANGAPEDLALAAPILEAVLRCQELDPRDPHVGNFYWMREDQVVEDLNAVEFVLEALIPLLMRHSDRLPGALRSRLLESVRLGLAEIARLDVLVAYTNITALDILNSALGGELIGDAAIAQRGYDKLVRWLDYTNQSGHPLEYNSPTYSAVTLRALKQLADHTSDDATRSRARALSARLALSYALHIHTGTGRLAGPHGRAYHPTIVGETPPEIETLRGWIADGVVPPWVADAVDARPARFQVTETAERSRGLAFSTFQTPAFALGVASQNFHGQSNHCMAHFARPGAARPGVFYTRYLLDDKWFGDSYHATDRTKSRNLLDEGDFFGVQDEHRAIGVYTCTALRQCHSAKAALIWTEHSQVDEVWVGERRITTLPAEAQPGELIIIASGKLLMAVRPLTISALGRETPILLLERDGDLVLELYNYRGDDKRFWELNWPGAFFQGRPICAFYVELAARHEYADAASFAQTVAAGRWTDELDAPFTYGAQGDRRYTAAYARDGRTVGLSIDAMQWRLRRRWNGHGELGFPMLESPMAAQSATGSVAVGNARVEAGEGPVWLFASPATGRWVAGYTGLAPTDLTLETPQGRVQVWQMGAGVVVWDNGQVDVEAVGNLQLQQIMT